MHDELDIIREVGSIAAAHGSIALSEILGKKICLTIPCVDMVVCSGVSHKIDIDRMGIAVICRIATGIQGEAVFLLDEKNAFKMINISTKISVEDKKLSVMTEMGLSTIKEIGNIVISSYLNAIGMILKKVVLSLPPTLISGTIDEILNIIMASSVVNDSALLVEAMFEESEEKMKGGFYLLLSQEAAADIRSACKKTLEEI